MSRMCVASCTHSARLMSSFFMHGMRVYKPYNLKYTIKDVLDVLDVTLHKAAGKITYDTILPA